MNIATPNPSLPNKTNESINMETINTKVLLSALERVMPGLADKKDFVQFYLTFSFYDNEIVTYNEHVSVRAPIPLSLNCSVLAKEFHAIIKKIDAPEIEVGIDSGQLKIQAPGLKAKMNVTVKNIDKEILEATHSKQGLEWKALPDKFQEAISLCTLSVSNKGILPWMTAITIDNNEVMSTDSYRISNYTLPESLGGKYFLPLSSMEGAIRESFSEYAITNQWFHMKASDNLVYSVKMMTIDDVPDMLKYLTTEGMPFVFPAGSDKIVDLVSVISESNKVERRSVMVKIDPGVLTFKSQRQDFGWIEREIPCEYTGAPVSFYINPEFAEYILKETRETIIGSKYCVFHSENFKHLVALFNTEEPKE